MKKQITFFIPLFLITALSAMELEQKVEEKKFEVPTLLEIAARYVAPRFFNPMHNQAMALSFLTGSNAQYLNQLTNQVIVQALARDAAEQLEEIFPKIPVQLQEKKEVSVATSTTPKIYSLDKKWFARLADYSQEIFMGNDVESKYIPIPLLPGYTEYAGIAPRAISHDNQLCLVEVVYIKNEKYAYHYCLGVDYNIASILYSHPLYDMRMSKDKSIFVGRNNENIIAYSLRDGLQLYKFTFPDIGYIIRISDENSSWLIPNYYSRSKIVLSEDNKYMLTNLKSKLYICDGAIGKLIRTLQVENNIKNYCLSNDNRSVAILDTNAISVFNIHSGKMRCSIKDNNCKTMDILKGFYDNNRFVITGENGIKDKSKIYLWDTLKNKLVAKKMIDSSFCGDDCSKVFIYPPVAKSLSLKELISLLALEKKWKAGTLNQNLLETIKTSECEWLKDLAENRYSKPAPQEKKLKEESEQKDRCPVM